jgi:ABC-2 type transport system ATP-binding protein
LLGAGVKEPAYMAARERTAIVPQGPGMYRDLTTCEYLELARRLYGRGEVAPTLEKFGLTAYRNRRLAQLSGGLQRRAVLAAALLAPSDVLLLDEPTVGLDPVAARDVHELLQNEMRGRTTLFCTHNLAEAEALCDEVLILREGRVLLHQSLAELRRSVRPQLRLVARQGQASLLAALTRRGVATVPDAEGTGVVVTLAHHEADAPDLLRALLAEGLDVFESHQLAPSLEDLFLDVLEEEPAQA